MKWPHTIGMFALASCSNAKDESPRRWEDSYSVAECTELMSLEAIEDRCGGGDVYRTMERLADDPTSCMPYSRSRQMAGLWVEGFEYSAFFEGANTWEDISSDVTDPQSELTWLSVSPNADLPQDDFVDYGKDWDFRKVSRVELVGKRSLCSFGYGHLGGSEHEVIAERFITVSPVSMTPKSSSSNVR